MVISRVRSAMMPTTWFFKQQLDRGASSVIDRFRIALDKHEQVLTKAIDIRCFVGLRSDAL